MHKELEWMTAQLEPGVVFKLRCLQSGVGDPCQPICGVVERSCVSAGGVSPFGHIPSSIVSARLPQARPARESRWIDDLLQPIEVVVLIIGDASERIRSEMRFDIRS
ncbi:MAG TPA: hypothetical protein VJ023_06005 [Pyrinomonadaceae bacterium]|nr:hypothetical protein [Pyrinomonadaceae bacterium]